MIASQPEISSTALVEDERYEEFASQIQTRFAGLTATSPPLFATDATALTNSEADTPQASLFDIFLAALPASRRQHYACNACRGFVNRFGGLVTIDDKGQSTPLLWPVDGDGVPLFFRSAAAKLHHLVKRARVTDVFLRDEATWGLASNPSEKSPTGVWSHLHVVPMSSMLCKPGPIQTVSQVVAEKQQDFQMLLRAIGTYKLETVQRAHALLSGGQLFRSEKCIGVAKWLLDLHEAIQSNPFGVALALDATSAGGRVLARIVTSNRIARNLIWRAVATAPAGFCHISSGMIGTLLDDIALGLPFEDIKQKFDAKMNPIKYQRPQAAPTAGNIEQAEAIVKKLGVAPSLARRFAKLEEIQAIWTPRAREAVVPPAEAGVFGHLKPDAAVVGPIVTDAPSITMTWEKFSKTILPTAEEIEFSLVDRSDSYFAFVTAADAAAPPILQWDSPERRNPVSLYCYYRGSNPSHWGLERAGFHKVTAIALHPAMWHGETKFANHGKVVCFVLDGAKDIRYESGGGFFPDMLRSEYHAIRATMEAFAKTAVIAGAAEATACGIGLQQQSVSSWNHVFRVTSRGVRTTYKLDRWD